MLTGTIGVGNNPEGDASAGKTHSENQAGWAGAYD